WWKRRSGSETRTFSLSRAFNSRGAGHLHDRALAEAKRKRTIFSSDSDLYSMRMKARGHFKTLAMRILAIMLVSIISSHAAVAQQRVVNRTQLATQVRTEFLH